jgi:hypothetical protein
MNAIPYSPAHREAYFRARRLRAEAFRAFLRGLFARPGRASLEYDPIKSNRFARGLGLALPRGRG